MNFLLMGCSWGVPNYYGAPGDPPETHTEYLLESFGHKVVNCAKNGGSNLYSLQRAEEYLAREEILHPGLHGVTMRMAADIKHIDWVVWFQTDFLRDFDNVPTSSINKIQTVAKFTYEQFQKFFESLQCKVALIGGNGDLHPCYKEYFVPDFVMPSWSSLILQVPTANLSMDDPELEFKYMDHELYLQKLKKTSPMFPDASHPGAKAHADLVQRLLTCVTSTPSLSN
jgi:hypothetical protein